VVLASTDPANLYGAALPWPAGEGARPMRAAGTHVVLVDGALAGFLGRGQKDLVTFAPAEEPHRSRVLRGVAKGLAAWVAATRRGNAVFVSADGQPMARSPLAPLLLEAGFVRSGPGFRYAGEAPAEEPDESPGAGEDSAPADDEP
jgi:ATP-dependent Lhr-like helicase